MAEIYSFFNSQNSDRKYNAKHWADYFKPLFKNGVFNGGLQVTANDDMTITINEGYAWIDGYAYHLDAPLTFDLETASGNMNRMDNVVIRLDTANRWVRAFVVTGAYYAGASVAPEIVRSTTIDERCLCQIPIPSGATKVTQSMIIDTRADAEKCGWVTGAVDQIDLEQITLQFNTFFAEYQAEIQSQYETYHNNIVTYETEQKADFEVWVASVKDILDTNVAGNLLLLIEQKMQKIVVQTVNEITTLVIEEELKLALAGFVAKETVFNTDGSITESDYLGNTKETVFNSDGSITTTYTFASGNSYTKITTFGTNSVTERISKNGMG